MQKQHKPNCSINIRCAVLHDDGICNHPQYGKCDCKDTPQSDTVSDFFTAPDEVKRPVYERALEKAQEEQDNYSQSEEDCVDGEVV